MTHIEYQKYIYGPKSSNLKNGVNWAGAYTIPRGVSYINKEKNQNNQNCQSFQNCQSSQKIQSSQNNQNNQNNCQ